MLEKILNKLGYIKKEKIDESLVLEYIISKHCNDFESHIDKKEERIIYKKLSEIEGLQDLLRKIMVRDMKNYFGSTIEQQSDIRGAYYRTLYLKNNISGAAKGDSLDNQRYGH